jgi:hypothetical protein
MSSYAIDRDAWAKLSIYEQLGNIGSEVGRAITAHRNGKEKRESSAIARALDLFAATVEVNLQTHPHRVKEVLRARDEFMRLFYDGTFDQDADKIERYFMYFAQRARLDHK